MLGKELSDYLTVCKQMIDISANKWVIYNPIYPTSPLGQDMTQGQFLSGV